MWNLIIRYIIIRCPNYKGDARVPYYIRRLSWLQKKRRIKMNRNKKYKLWHHFTDTSKCPGNRDEIWKFWKLIFSFLLILCWFLFWNPFMLSTLRQNEVLMMYVMLYNILQHFYNISEYILYILVSLCLCLTSVCVDVFDYESVCVWVCVCLCVYVCD